ncbi:LamG domain-containing protein [Cellulomonas marina]|uniref:Concanavalin A-like lectin/glucanases superfamily protein n=1 Tax=Cellulomonas marina TaxID=988821 RepID=A0A1I1AMS6_9CELL|nr:LamG domain-containing protein [Cellulomonas marina]GIG30421.1 hypothetical protein Cma02nite_30210 [Cellulomonas marina]SFB39349.1 Concanavalin A-like lectin/glucanases superfamily protein [Cellulomonas marina]
MHVRRRAGVVAVLAALALALPLGPLGVPAHADTAPLAPTDPATPVTVSADALPTAQINGVAWTQVVVGNTVYVGGKFTSARPAGSPAGTNETPRSNLLAYDLTTGALSTTFKPAVNAQIRSMAASPDGKRLYIAGDFTSVDGTYKGRIAAIDLATGKLVTTFTGSLGGAAYAVAASATRVYVGGAFTTAANKPGGTAVTRNRLLALDASTGAVSTFRADTDQPVTAVAVTADGSKLVVGGRFTRLSGVGASGLGWVDAATGASRALPASSTIRTSTSSAAVTQLSADSTGIYGSAYSQAGNGGTGNVEGTFRLDPATGKVLWVADCYGDSYGIARLGSAVYVSSHSHTCANIGGFPEETPRVERQATAFSVAATGVNTAITTGHGSHAGEPAPSSLEWFPTMTKGTASGQNQASWAVAAAGQYVVYAGEFLSVNGTPQQGLVRFAASAVAPDKLGPVLAAAPVTATATTAGTVRVGVTTARDPDNRTLTYKVYRGSSTTPVWSATITTPFWKPVTRVFDDKGLTAGGTASYKVVVSDPQGNTKTSSTVSTTVRSSGAATIYTSALAAAKPTFHWSLGDTGATAADSSPAGVTGTYYGSPARGVAGLVQGTDGKGVALNGDAQYVASSAARTAPSTYSEELWFSSTSRTGGALLGFGSSATSLSTSHDRHLILGADGRISFGTYSGGRQIISSGLPYNDGRPHHVVATQSSAGQRLYVDGSLVASSTVTGAQAGTGYWRVGGDASWDTQPWVTGTIDEVTVWPVALDAAAVARHYALGVPVS